MDKITEQYLSYLKLGPKTGDIILFVGTGFLSEAIMDVTKTGYSHSAVVYLGDKGKANYINIIQSTINKKANGMEVYPLWEELNGDIYFTVLRPVGFTDEQISEAISTLQEKIHEKAKYNKLFYLRFLLYKFFKWNDKAITQRNAYVCSTAVRLYTNALGITAYMKDELIIPADFIKYKPNNIQIILT